MFISFSLTFSYLFMTPWWGSSNVSMRMPFFNPSVPVPAQKDLIIMKYLSFGRYLKLEYYASDDEQPSFKYFANSCFVKL